MKESFAKLEKRLLFIKNSFDFIGMDKEECKKLDFSYLDSVLLSKEKRDLTFEVDSKPDPIFSILLFVYTGNNKMESFQLEVNPILAYNKNYREAVTKVVAKNEDLKDEFKSITKNIILGKNSIFHKNARNVKGIEAIPIPMRSTFGYSGKHNYEKGYFDWRRIFHLGENSSEKKEEIYYQLEPLQFDLMLKEYKEEPINTLETFSFKKGDKSITIPKKTALKIPFLVPIIKEEFKVEKDEKGAYLLDKTPYISIRTIKLCCERIENNISLDLLLLKELFSNPNSEYYNRYGEKEKVEFDEVTRGLSFWKKLNANNK